MKKVASKNEFMVGVHQILEDYRDILPFQDRVILNRKFTHKDTVSIKTQEVVKELDCNWVDVGNAIQKLINILRVKNKWLIEQAAQLTQADEDKNAAVIAWLGDQRKENGKMAARLCALRDEEKKTDEKARLEWRAGRVRHAEPKR